MRKIHALDRCDHNNNSTRLVMHGMHLMLRTGHENARSALNAVSRIQVTNAHTAHVRAYRAENARSALNAASRIQAPNAHTGHENARSALNATSRIQAPNAHECA